MTQKRIGLLINHPVRRAARSQTLPCRFRPGPWEP